MFSICFLVKASILGVNPCWPWPFCWSTPLQAPLHVSPQSQVRELRAAAQRQMQVLWMVALCSFFFWARDPGKWHRFIMIYWFKCYLITKHWGSTIKIGIMGISWDIMEIDVVTCLLHFVALVMYIPSGNWMDLMDFSSSNRVKNVNGMGMWRGH